MSLPTQGLMLAFVGAVMLRLSLSDDYLRYVTEWMKWPMAATGLLLLLLAIAPSLETGSQRRPRDPKPSEDQPDAGRHDHATRNGGVPAVTWLLVLPGLVTFVIAPPALGSFLAERRADEMVVTEPAQVNAVAEAEVLPIGISDFIWYAQEGGDEIAGRTVELTGFVSYGGEEQWYVTRMAIGCCAADAVSWRVEVMDMPRPPRDAWVRVTGVHLPGSGRLTESGNAIESPAAVEAVDVTPTTAPAQTYS